MPDKNRRRRRTPLFDRRQRISAGAAAIPNSIVGCAAASMALIGPIPTASATICHTRPEAASASLTSTAACSIDPDKKPAQSTCLLKKKRRMRQRVDTPRLHHRLHPRSRRANQPTGKNSGELLFMAGIKRRFAPHGR
jgi:hypothetical protein